MHGLDTSPNRLLNLVKHGEDHKGLMVCTSGGLWSVEPLK